MDSNSACTITHLSLQITRVSGGTFCGTQTLNMSTSAWMSIGRTKEDLSRALFCERWEAGCERFTSEVPGISCGSRISTPVTLITEELRTICETRASIGRLC